MYNVKDGKCGIKEVEVTATGKFITKKQANVMIDRDRYLISA